MFATISNAVSDYSMRVNPLAGISGIAISGTSTRTSKKVLSKNKNAKVRASKDKGVEKILNAREMETAAEELALHAVKQIWNKVKSERLMPSGARSFSTLFSKGEYKITEPKYPKANEECVGRLKVIYSACLGTADAESGKLRIDNIKRRADCILDKVIEALGEDIYTVENVVAVETTETPKKKSKAKATKDVTDVEAKVTDGNSGDLKYSVSDLASMPVENFNEVLDVVLAKRDTAARTAAEEAEAELAALKKQQEIELNAASSNPPVSQDKLQELAAAKGRQPRAKGK